MKAFIVIGNLLLLFDQSIVGQKIEQIQTQVEDLTKVKTTLEKNKTALERKMSVLQDSINLTALKIDSLNGLIPVIQQQALENEIKKLLPKDFNTKLTEGTFFLEQPNKDSKTVGGLQKGTKVKVLSLEAFPYYKVKYKNQVGYVHSLYLELPKAIEDIELKLLNLPTKSTSYLRFTPAPPNESNKYNYTPSRTSTNCTTVQCSGFTKKGERCQNRTTNCSGRCHLH